MPNHQRSRLPHVLVTPTLILLIAALGYPVAWQIITSFKEFGLRQQFGAPSDWVGFANYGAIVTDPTLWGIVLRSLGFCLIVSFATVLIGGLLAGLMNARRKGGPPGSAGGPPARLGHAGRRVDDGLDLAG
jgi:N,N'-diacetylchitobiose transport system permease protein